MSCIIDFHFHTGACCGATIDDSMMRLSGTEGTDGVEEEPGRRVLRCKAAVCRASLWHRNGKTSGNKKVNRRYPGRVDNQVTGSVKHAKI